MFKIDLDILVWIIILQIQRIQKYDGHKSSYGHPLCCTSAVYACWYMAVGRAAGLRDGVSDCGRPGWGIKCDAAKGCRHRQWRDSGRSTSAPSSRNSCRRGHWEREGWIHLTFARSYLTFGSSSKESKLPLY